MQHGPRAGTLAARIKAARALADVTQAELAQELGVSLITVKRYEANWRDNTFSDEQVEAIARVTGVPLSFLHDGFGEASDPRQIGAVRDLSRTLGVFSNLVVELCDINEAHGRPV